MYEYDPVSLPSSALNDSSGESREMRAGARSAAAACIAAAGVPG